MPFWSCEEETRGELIIGYWNLSSVCIYKDDGDIILTLSNDMLTFTSIDDYCFKFTLTK